MGYMDDFLTLLKSMRTKFSYDMNIPNFYGIADFRRNEFVIYGRKAVREYIRQHAERLDKTKRQYVSQLLNKAVMQLWLHPELKSYFEDKLNELIGKGGYGIIRWGIDPWGG